MFEMMDIEKSGFITAERVLEIMDDMTE